MDDKKEIEIFRKMGAFLLFTEKGMAEAVRIYPAQKEFIEKHKHQSYTLVRQGLVDQLNKI